MDIIDLSGNWRYETDPEDTGYARKLYLQTLCGEGFHLPGSACENRVGAAFDASKLSFEEIIRAPHERFEYIGALWLQRDIDLPAPTGLC